jgi:NlpC/P60 family putative phage cell wall peptidase
VPRSQARAISSRVVAEARQWVGTPFVWGQSVKGVGCDCKGLIQGVARELGLPEAESFYATFAAYRPDKPVPVALLKEGMAAVFDQADEPRPGDVLLLKMAGRAQHLGIFAGDTVIHAQGAGHKRRVKETRFDALSKMCPVDSIWRWR